MDIQNNHFNLPVVRGFELYRSGSLVVKYLPYTAPTTREPAKRDAIEKLSAASRRRLALLVTETSLPFKSLATLTYPKTWPGDGREVKRHVNKACNWFRRNGALYYVWFLEFQKRGAPHLHYLLGGGVGDRRRLARTWARMISDEETERAKIRRVHEHGDSWQEIRKADGAKRYASKYAHKTAQKIVPKNYQNVGRFWGASRCVREGVAKPDTVDCSEWNLRKFLEATNHPCAHWEKLPGQLYGVNS